MKSLVSYVYIYISSSSTVFLTTAHFFLSLFSRDQLGRFFTILESPSLIDETTGLSFSPDGKHMYIAYQENGLLYDVTREDGLAFNAKSLDVKYHNSISTRRLNSQWIGL